MTELKDWRGNSIEVGSRIVYPVRVSSSLWMNEAVVTAIGTYEHEYSYRTGRPQLSVHVVVERGRPVDRNTKIDQISRVTVVQ